MPFSGLDTAAISRSLAQVADRKDDVAEAYFELVEEVELPEDGSGPGMRSRREGGFAVRLLRRGMTWIAARDGFEPQLFTGALRTVARALPPAPYPEPRLTVGSFPGAGEAEEVLRFPPAVRAHVRERLVAFPMRLRTRRHRRAVQVVGPQLVAAPELEAYYSVEAELPWGRCGALLSELSDAAAERFAEELMERFTAREAPPPAAGPTAVVLGPAAAAVLLHEAVAHALESDTLILGGMPEAAVDQRIGADCLNVLDDPGAAPPSVRRATDDEGVTVSRRWLVREGIVRQPLADLFAARESEGLTPGAARRAGRHSAPVPRSHHLELLTGDAGWDELLSAAEGGLLLPTASRGSLDPLTGAFALHCPYGYRIADGRRGEPVAGCRLVGRVVELLGRVAAVGSQAEPAGAGWCVKGGQRLPVWAKAPALRLTSVEIRP